VPSVSPEVVRQALSFPLQETDFRELGRKYEGKVRDNYTTLDGRRILVVTDRISAFDRVLGTLPLKGQLLNHVAAFWFRATESICPNHVLDVPDPNVLIAKECTPLPVEMVVRAYLTGTTDTSIWVHYQRGVRTFCGHALPDGLRNHERLPHPIVTPSTKAAKGRHDVSASREEILQLTGLPARDFDRAAEFALALFRFGQQWCAERGLILVDTKYEFGKTTDGEIVVIDEIHTPDSSRYWYEASYAERFEAGLDPESFDKDQVRRYLSRLGFAGDGPIPPIPDEVRVEAILRYMDAVEMITAAPFVPNLDRDPVGRVARALGLTHT
jgi:phosphoribosylaminoimidazole-succinocarboxamide synthase